MVGKNYGLAGNIPPKKDEHGGNVALPEKVTGLIMIYKEQKRGLGSFGLKD